ncbi:MAG: hypothetical protein OEV55_02065 [candidate division Zixibacteria bacterium]|nr:hypothetical protein [candidate division Zixibacteria bacterium]
MTSRKCLAVFLILLFFLPFVPLANAGGPDKPMLDHPWEEVKKDFPPKPVKPQFILPEGISSILMLSPGYFPNLIVPVVKISCKEEVKKDCSEITRSLPRMK